MNEVTIFKFNEQVVRTIRDEYGEPWFVARDTCDILGLENITWALEGLDDDELTLVKLKSGGQNHRKVSAGKRRGGRFGDCRGISGDISVLPHYRQVGKSCKE
jgi:prophage antirepressor-like protein